LEELLKTMTSFIRITVVLAKIQTVHEFEYASEVLSLQPTCSIYAGSAKVLNEFNFHNSHTKGPG
jgi:hypothetical protein